MQKLEGALQIIASHTVYVCISIWPSELHWCVLAQEGKVSIVGSDKAICVSERPYSPVCVYIIEGGGLKCPH